MPSLESRLAAVERQLHVQRLLIAGLLLALVALLSYGARRAPPPVVRAQQFEAVNAQGQVVWTAGYDAQGNGLAAIRNHGGTVVAGMDVDAAGAGQVRAFTAKGEQGAALYGALAPAGGALTVYNGQGNPAVLLNVSATHGGLVRVFDRHTHTTGTLPLPFGIGAAK